MNRTAAESNRCIVVAQFSVLLGFVLFSAGVIGWIIHLVRLSIELDDVPDASMAISLVAIPVFLTLAGIMAFVVIGLVMDPEARAERKEMERDDRR